MSEDESGELMMEEMGPLLTGFSEPESSVQPLLDLGTMATDELVRAKAGIIGSELPCSTGGGDEDREIVRREQTALIVSESMRDPFTFIYSFLEIDEQIRLRKVCFFTLNSFDNCMYLESILRGLYVSQTTGYSTVMAPSKMQLGSRAPLKKRVKKLRIYGVDDVRFEVGNFLRDCLSLEEAAVINLPNLVSLNQGFLSRCPQLSQLILEDLPQLQSFPVRFLQSTGLQTISFSRFPQLAKIEEAAFSKCPNLVSFELSYVPALRTCENRVLSDCPKLQRAFIESGKEKSEPFLQLGEGVLQNCGLVHANPESLKAYAALMDSPCGLCSMSKQLETATFVNSEAITRFNREFLFQCPLLTSIVLKNLPNLRDLGLFFGAQCSSLKSVVLEQLPLLEEIRGFFLSHSSLQSFVLCNLPELRNIEHGVLSSCTQLQNLELNHLPALHSIKVNFGSQCPALESVSITEVPSLEYIFRDFLSRCPALHSVRMVCPSLREIRDGGFNGCSSLTPEGLDLHLPKLVEIPPSLFEDSSSSVGISIPRLVGLVLVEANHHEENDSVNAGSSDQPGQVKEKRPSQPLLMSGDDKVTVDQIPFPYLTSLHSRHFAAGLTHLCLADLPYLLSISQLCTTANCTLKTVIITRLPALLYVSGSFHDCPVLEEFTLRDLPALGGSTDILLRCPKIRIVTFEKICSHPPPAPGGGRHDPMSLFTAGFLQDFSPSSQNGEEEGVFETKPLQYLETIHLIALGPDINPPRVDPRTTAYRIKTRKKVKVITEGDKNTSRVGEMFLKILEQVGGPPLKLKPTKTEGGSGATKNSERKVTVAPRQLNRQLQAFVTVVQRALTDEELELLAEKLRSKQE